LTFPSASRSATAIQEVWKYPWGPAEPEPPPFPAGHGKVRGTHQTPLELG